MARKFPADTRGQRILEELYEKELKTQIAWFWRNIQAKNKPDGAQISETRTTNVAEVPIRPELRKLEHPMTLKKAKSLECERKSSDTAKSVFESEMIPPDGKTLQLLYDGISREGRGRAKYFKERNLAAVEERYRYPVLSSMDYGWGNDKFLKMGTTGRCKENAKVMIVQDSFYRRNGISMKHCDDML
ncbi:unnamed protein product [Dicrocoelium dendriticum]|nr:unnamed protein product [Dicrocoelium dendriticum]